MTDFSKPMSDPSNARRAAKKAMAESNGAISGFKIIQMIRAGGIKCWRVEFDTALCAPASVPAAPVEAILPAPAIIAPAATVDAPVTPVECLSVADRIPETFATDREALASARETLGFDAARGEDFLIEKHARGYVWLTREFADRLAARKVEREASAKAKAPAKAAPAAGAPRAHAKTKELFSSAAAGHIPSAPDFSAETHKRFRPRLAALVAMVEAGDVAGLKAYPINPISSSPKALDRYRNAAVTALEARAAKEQQAA